MVGNLNFINNNSIAYIILLKLGGNDYFGNKMKTNRSRLSVNESALAH